jgi:MFS family permease
LGSAVTAHALVGERRYGLILAPLAVFLLGSTAMTTAIVPALPTIQREHGVSTSAMAWVLAITLVVSSVSTPIFGRLGDMFGKRRVLLIMCAIMCAGCLLAAIPGPFALLVVARALQGFGSGAISICLAIARDELPPERRAAAYGRLMGTWGVGAAAAFPLAGLVIDTLSYRALFWIALAIFVVSTIAIRLWVPESTVRSPAPIDWVGAALFMPGLAALLLALSRGGHWGWSSPRTLGLFAAGAVLLSAWIVWELRTRAPLTDLRLFGTRAVASVNASALLVAFAMYTVFFVVPAIVQTDPSAGYGFGASATEAGSFLIPMAVMQLVGANLLGRLIPRFGSKALNVAGCACALVGYVVFAEAFDDRWSLLLAIGLAGFGAGTAVPAASHLISLAVPQRQIAEANGMTTMVRSVGGSAGPTVVAATLAAFGATAGSASTRTGYTVVFAIGIGVVVAAIVAGLAAPDLRADRR